jgi:ribonuclease VapC
MLAWLQAEPGAAVVEAELADGAISSLYWAEVLQKSLSHGVDIADDAEQAARLWSPGGGLSLADRACLALGLRHGVPVWTADWMCCRTAVGATVHVRQR